MLYTWAYNRSTNGRVAGLHWAGIVVAMHLLNRLGMQVWDAAYEAGVRVLPKRTVPWAMMPDAPYGAGCPDKKPCLGEYCTAEGEDIFPRTFCAGMFNFTKCRVLGQYLTRAHQSSDRARLWNVRTRVFDLCVTMNVAFYTISYFVCWMVKDLTGCGPDSWTFKAAILLVVAGFVGDLVENVPLLYASLIYPHNDRIYRIVCWAYFWKFWGYVFPSIVFPPYCFWRLMICGSDRRLKQE